MIFDSTFALDINPPNLSFYSTVVKLSVEGCTSEAWEGAPLKRGAGGGCYADCASKMDQPSALELRALSAIQMH